ncbi:MAG: thiolase family protein [Sneathiellaceae bacterium]
MTDVYIVGVGMTPFGKYMEKSVRDLTTEAVGAALRDAGAGADLALGEQVDSAFFANAAQGAMERQFSIRGELALRDIPLRPVPVVNVENACASASTALNMAYTHILSGQSDVALAVGAEKMFDDDKAKMFGIFDGSWDVHGVEQSTATLLALGEGVATPEEYRDTGPHSVFMDVYQAFAKFHMREFGTTARQIAAVAAKNHRHSVDNPLAQYRKPFTVDEVLAGRMIAWPITLPMCSPISDGAAAAILCSGTALSRFDKARAIRIRGTALGSGGRRDPRDYKAEVSHLTAKRAYEIAGLDPADIDVAEVHDATALGEIQQAENLMLCGFGEGGPLAEGGATTIGGRIPVNPSGGLECKGHPIGATGLGQVYELVGQLRGEMGPRQVEGARIAVAENGGGLIGVESAAVCVTVLEKAA